MALSSYPPPYKVKANLQQAIGSNSLSPAQLLAELHSVADSLNQMLGFIRAAQNADKTLRPAQFSATIQVEQQTETATAGQTEFLFQNGLTIDASTSTVAVYSDGVRIDPNSITVSSDRVAIPAQTAGAVVVWDIHENADSVFLQLASTATSLGAALIGLEDAFGNYSSSNVEDALAEIALKVDALETAIGAVGDYMLRDGSRSWTGDHDAGGNRLTNMSDGVAGSDAATVAQLSAATGGSYLALAGGTMTGPIAMGDNKITGVADAEDDQDALNLRTAKALSILNFPAGSTDTTRVLSPDGAGGLIWRLEGGGSVRDYGSLVTESTPPTEAVLTDNDHGATEILVSNLAGSKTAPGDDIAGTGADETESVVVFASEASNGSLITQEQRRIAIGAALGSAQVKVAGTLALLVSQFDVSGISGDFAGSIRASILTGDTNDSYLQFTNGTIDVKAYADALSSVDIMTLDGAGGHTKNYNVGDAIPLAVCDTEFFLDPVAIDTLFTATISVESLYLYRAGAGTFAGSITLRGYLTVIDAECRVDRLS